VRPFVLLCSLFLLSAVPERGAQDSAQTARFTSRAAAVRVDALVTSGRRPVPGLTAVNFELRDNGVVQTINDVHHETLPLNIICVLDLSGSVVGQPLAHLKQGLRGVIAALAGQDRAALLTFAHRIELHTALTADRARLLALVDGVQAGGTTALFDAVFAALALRETDEGRTLLLLFSDGRDTSSWLTARKLVDSARRTDVVIYPVTIRTLMPLVTVQGKVLTGGRQSRPEPSERLLEALAEDTGGRVVYASDEAAVEATFLEVLREFRQRYVLSYSPTGVSDSGWHTIEVKLRGKSGEVRARRGYFAR
jgi:Ca-activated chloride channel homolog